MRNSGAASAATSTIVLAATSAQELLTDRHCAAASLDLRVDRLQHWRATPDSESGRSWDCGPLATLAEIACRRDRIAGGMSNDVGLAKPPPWYPHCRWSSNGGKPSALLSSGIGALIFWMREGCSTAEITMRSHRRGAGNSGGSASANWTKSWSPWSGRAAATPFASSR